MVVYVVTYHVPSDSDYDTFRTLGVFKNKEKAIEFAKEQGPKLIKWGDAQWYEEDWTFGNKYGQCDYGARVEVESFQIQ
jgi:hypothetical protein